VTVRTHVARALRASLLIAWVLPALSGCGGAGAALSPQGSAQTGSFAAAGRLRGAPSGSPIAHVVFIIQENRSFDDLFQGYPGANTASSGLDSSGNTVALQPIPLEAPYDVAHGAADFVTATDGGKMDGFDKELIEGNAGKYAHPQYGYVPHAESKLYFDMAKQYVLADNMFPSNIDASYVSHQYAIAAQADAAVDLPVYFGCNGSKANVVNTWTQQQQYGPTEQTCRNYRTMADELDAAGLSWRYYAYATDDWIWAGYSSVRHIRYGADWANVVAPETKVLKDIAKGDLPSVTWVTPNAADSDHSSSDSKTGPAWVASVVDAVGESKYWNSTAIFVMWDEWGGWYDHVVPPREDYDGLGIRVPLLVISPYAKQHYVSHVQYETGSVLRFIEDTFGLATLAASDARAADPAADCFDFSKGPRAFKKFATAPFAGPVPGAPGGRPDDE
jgi:phospholipase C